ncbi:MAG: Asp-tRNA(Asn)/Glu-tRNA(Gln) amidotransferase subunit GatA [Planctomycetes bacterium]|nr:Asp-tRNA(Asn)/Glu-tRNA(Gln) amidotransferase subunit GatA [Planctomycetota bacterium]
MNAPFEGLDATGLRDAICAGQRGVRETTAACLDAIEASQDTLGAFLTIERESALARAEELERSDAEPGPLHGVPVAIKANLCWEGHETNCASRLLEGWRAPYSATSVERLLAAGAVPVGVTNMDEFAMGSSGENSAFGPARNPWDTTRIPGGSSSGSAVAVAARLVPLALGSDTGGSVRQPAALCGVYGYKPTYGRVSRYGLVAFGSSLDQVSPFVTSARDLALCMSVIGGHDPRDSTSLELDAPSAALRGEVALTGLKVGVPKEHFPPELDKGTRAACEAALARLEERGCELVEVSLPHASYAIPTYYVVATAEASSNLARFDGVAYGQRVDGDGSLNSMFAATRAAGFGDEVKRRILIGTYALSAGYQDEWYGRATRARTLLRRDYEAAFERCDVIAAPTSPTVAFPLGERTEDPVSMYLADILTVSASLAGLPAVSAPAGFAAPADDPTKSLPVGLQLTGPHACDERVIEVAGLLESTSDDHLKTPSGGAA